MTEPTNWHPNRGHPPVFYPLSEDEACPPDLIHADEADGARVQVRLRNGVKPRESWPVFGRPIPTRWTRTRAPFDITHWSRA